MSQTWNDSTIAVSQYSSSRYATKGVHEDVQSMRVKAMKKDEVMLYFPGSTLNNYNS